MAIWALLVVSVELQGQHYFSDSSLFLGGYAEVYYGYDFGRPDDHRRPGFLYSFNRANEFNLNLGMIQLGYREKNVRANLALMAGTYPNANLAQEPDVLKNVFEANVGVKVSRDNELWIDAGIMPSHIGFETAIGSLCPNLSRSMLADNSPYYETGAKLTYTSKNKEWMISALMLNGWQRIRGVDGNSLPSFGHQLTWTPGERTTLNSSTFIGTDDPDSTRRMRYFHNFFWQYRSSQKWSFIAGLDLGFQQREKGSSEYYHWLAPILIARFTPCAKWAFAGRIEYFEDKGEVIVAPGGSGGFGGFRNSGFSMNADHWVTPNICWRMEARVFKSPDAIYIKNNEPVTSNFALFTSLAVNF
ncbi:MAG TPA: porin [Phnomibacter sp.]|nr:porin [Phnomibacter sp.]